MITAKASSPGRTMLGMEAAWVPREADPQARSEGEASFGAPAGYKDPLCTEGDSKCQQDESRGLSLPDSFPPSPLLGHGVVWQIGICGALCQF